MKVLITGASGQLGGALLRTAPAHADLNAIDIDDVDFVEAAMLRARLVVEAPEVIINAAAYTSVDGAEREEEVAREVNAEAVAILVEAVAGTGGKLVQVSSDLVFDGTATRAYLPADTPNPRSAYGRTKAEGEAHLRPEDLLVRTAWLYEAGGTNFVCDMLKLMKARDRISAAADQISSPTWATGLARTIWALVERQASGTFHHVDAGAVSLHDYTLAIAEEALALGLIERMPTIQPITITDDQAATRQPSFAALDCSATRAFLGDSPMDWRVNLRLMLSAEKALG
jgi:dTDP-4-dehydrorhamnose reductase